MLRRIGIAILWSMISFCAGAFGGGYALYLMSSNQHDGSVEAAMTGAFVFGPLAASIGFVIGLYRTRKKTSTV